MTLASVTQMFHVKHLRSQRLGSSRRVLRLTTGYDQRSNRFGQRTVDFIHG
jgi:hypothetical protein